jgi:hypothetical protein
MLVFHPTCWTKENNTAYKRQNENNTKQTKENRETYAMSEIELTRTMTTWKKQTRDEMRRMKRDEMEREMIKRDEKRGGKQKRNGNINHHTLVQFGSL